jgi:hypothetical protein
MWVIIYPYEEEGTVSFPHPMQEEFLIQQDQDGGKRH